MSDNFFERKIPHGFTTMPPQPILPATGADWFVRSGGQESGPFTVDELKARATSGAISPEDQIRKGRHSWSKASSFFFLQEAFAGNNTGGRTGDDASRNDPAAISHGTEPLRVRGLMMFLGYRLLQTGAWLNHHLSGWRVNFFWPADWVVMFVLAGACLSSAVTACKAFIHDDPPVALPIREALGRRDLTNRYVSVSGTLLAKWRQAFVRRGGRAEEAIEAVYVPFAAEDESTPILFVKYKQAPALDAAHPATVSGMLRPPDSQLLEKAPEIKQRIPVTIDWTNVLSADDRPPNPWPSLALAVACGLLAGMMFFAKLLCWPMSPSPGQCRDD
jgi:GYF domain 2